MKKWYILGMFALILCLSTQAQTATKYATAEIVEVITKDRSYFRFIDENGVVKKIPLRSDTYENMGLKDREQESEANQKTITQALNEIGQKGYVLIGITSEQGGSTNHTFTRMVFKKE